MFNGCFKLLHVLCSGWVLITNFYNVFCLYHVLFYKPRKRKMMSNRKRNFSSVKDLGQSHRFSTHLAQSFVRGFVRQLFFLEYSHCNNAVGTL